MPNWPQGKRPKRRKDKPENQVEKKQKKTRPATQTPPDATSQPDPATTPDADVTEVKEDVKPAPRKRAPRNPKETKTND